MEIFLSFAFSVMGVIIVLVIDREKYPKIEIIASKEANADNIYQIGPRKGERWKFFRVSVKNKKMPSWVNWLLVRQTAENCRANVYIKGVANKTDISFKGRWASTPEIPHLANDSVLLKLLYPDPVTIVEGNSEYLDVITKFKNEPEAYGWNNESYMHSWRNPNYKLNPGQYKVRVVINTQNGISSTRDFILNVGDKIENTELKS